MWEVEPNQIAFQHGTFSYDGKRLSFKELAGKLGDTGGPIVASVTVHPETEGVAFAVHIADVEVDTETGKVDIIRYTTVQDVRTAIHPSYVEGQMPRRRGLVGH
jgi:CO/xanthine dehydrogenase Mo-binding subunit